MAARVPAKMKSADVTRFAHRAAQLDRYKPIVSYWCDYHIVQQILAKGLHTADEECMQYTTMLMDKLEQAKTEHANEDAILDDVAAKAYIEQFGLDTFRRADDAVRANQASKQTADTFQAAATFLDLMTIWGPQEPEIASKSKYAKYHALRIAKALKAGEDPNLSNPTQEPATEETMSDPDDPEVRQINGYTQPSVEDAPDAFQLSSMTSAHRDVTMESPAPQTSLATTGAPQSHPDVSPLQQPSPDRTNSAGGGYFPNVPTFTSDSAAPALPTAPPAEPMDHALLPQEDPSMLDVQNYYAGPPKASVPMVPAPEIPSPTPQAPSGGYRSDDASVMSAQKHAKWAMSALNFDDVGTAVKELRLALNSLGAR
ncbi:hypothetical protein B0A49_07983 [Cryomyces minteri]|uniref:Vta1 C-terminal domain-containing protein n=1 Tax=Cryomyces minteri TaxID=331657 RepID=A0A4U0WKK8_9PEZI|nr:hypothetical protein B0A49_07983 [Cryomyces minteri]